MSPNLQLTPVPQRWPLRERRRTETRPVSGFSRVDLRDYGDLVLTQGDTGSLVVAAPAEQLAKIRSEVQGDTLVLEVERDWLARLLSGILSLGRQEKEVRYYLTVKTLTAVSIAGAGNLQAEEVRSEGLRLSTSGIGHVQISALQAPRLDVSISGRAEYDLAGTVSEQHVTIRGSGEYRADQLASQRTQIRISGHGAAAVQVDEALDVTISGFGEVDYRGEPHVNQRVSGAGRIQRTA